MKTIIIDGVEYNCTPKVAFREGDWVIDKQGIVHQIANVIENVTCHTYGYDIVGGGYFNDNTEGVRLWTTACAKDGDVLVNGSNIFIFHFTNDTRLMGYCHINTDDGRFYDDIGKNECFCLIDAVVNPATKEQRDILFKAMDEAGYTFDFDKKELKKIGQNTAWSEDDETKLITAKTFIVNTSLVGNDGIKEATIEWLNDLKNRVHPKPAWSEEDERQFSIFIRHCYLKKNLYKKENNKEFAQKCQGLIDWLEAIKQRAELAVDNPNEKAIVKYLYEKKGYPIDLNGNLVSYEEAMESANRYINYKKEKFIEKACEWMKDNITYTHPRKGTEECVVNLEKFKDYMKGE